MELGNTEAIKKLVEAGVGLSITSWFAVRAEVAAGQLVALPLEPPLVRRIGVIRRRGRAAAGPLEAFLGGLESLRRDLERGRRAPAARGATRAGTRARPRAGSGASRRR